MSRKIKMKGKSGERDRNVKRIKDISSEKESKLTSIAEVIEFRLSVESQNDRESLSCVSLKRERKKISDI